MLYRHVKRATEGPKAMNSLKNERGEDEEWRVRAAGAASRVRVVRPKRGSSLLQMQVRAAGAIQLPAQPQTSGQARAVAP